MVPTLSGWNISVFYLFLNAFLIYVNRMNNRCEGASSPNICMAVSLLNPFFSCLNRLLLETMQFMEL